MQWDTDPPKNKYNTLTMEPFSPKNVFPFNSNTF